MSMDDIDNPLAELEEAAVARRVIDELTRTAAEVVIDLEAKGGLYHFLREQFEATVAALLALATVSPADTVAIHELQQQIRPYLAACQFIRSAIERGEQVDQAIEEMHADDEDQSHDD